MTRLYSIDNLAPLLSLLLHDLLLLCSFLLRHPLILAYLLLLSPHLLKLVFFLSPLLFSTSLLLLAFLTVPTQLSEPPPSAMEFPGRTCGAVLHILHVGLVPDEAKTCLTEQLCSMLLAAGDHFSQTSACRGSDFSYEEHGPVKQEKRIGIPIPACRTEHNRRLSGILLRDNSVRRDKEWKRTLACKLFEERTTYKLCEGRKADEGAESMDLLWEAYEEDARKAEKRGRKERRGRTEEEEAEEDVDCDEVGMFGRLCCLTALRFPTGKTSLVKISMAVKGAALFHPSARRRGRSCKS